MTTVESRLDLDAGPLIGQIELVDADRVDIALEDAASLALVTVSDLVAMKVTDGFVVGLVEAITRERMRTRLVGTVDPLRGSFRVGAAAHPKVDSACHLIDGERLSAFMSMLGADLGESERLVLGHFVADRGTVAVADGNRLFQRHMSILGNTGSGKSWTVALLLERAAKLREPNIIVLDLHGEYAPLGLSVDDQAPVARGLRIAGPADLVFAGDEVLHVPFWLLELEELLAMIVNENDPYSSDQRLCLTDRVQTLKRSTLASLGHADSVATATADSPVPYKLEDLVRWLKGDEVETIVRQPSGRVDPGPFAGKLGGMIARLESRVADPRYSFIFYPPEPESGGDWLTETAEKLLATGSRWGGIKTIDLSEVPAPILPLVAAVLARLVYNVQFWIAPEARTPVCLVCDEAHVYLPADERRSSVHRVALDAFEMIAKEGRKYGVCLAVVSQRPSDVSRTILSQCNNFMIMRLTNDQDQEVVEHLVAGAFSGVTGMLPLLDVGEAVVIGDAILLPLPIKLDPPDCTPASVTIPFWSEWASKSSSSEAIEAGVEALRTQWRGAD